MFSETDLDQVSLSSAAREKAAEVHYHVNQHDTAYVAIYI